MNGIQSLVPAMQKARKPRKARVPKYADGGTTYTTNVPAFAEQPYRDLVQSAVDVTQMPYETYPGERTATFNPMQEQGFTGVSNLTPSGQSLDAAGLAALAGNKALSSSTYDPSKFSSTLPGGPQQTSTQSFIQPGTADAYMNPYMQGVVDVAKRETTRQDDIARTNRNAAAVGAGAFGGSRQAIVEAEAGRNLGQRLNDIQTQGSDAAYKQAAQQFNTEQQLGLQSQTTNQNAGLTFNQQDLDRQKMEEASRQFGANLGVQGAGTAATAASTLGGIGSDLYKQNQNAAVTQVTTGTGQQEQAQKVLDQQYQDFLKQQNDPTQKLGFLSDILHGTQGTSRSVYDTPAEPSNLQTLAGLGTLLYGATKAKGGTVQRASAIDRGLARIAPDSVGEFAAGGIVGYAAGGTSAWDEFDTPPPNRNAGPVKPRALPPAAAAAAADAEAAAAAAGKTSLLRKVVPFAARAQIPIALGERGLTIYNTPTEEYATRFGEDPNADRGLLGDMNLRAKGAADDLTFGIPRWLYNKTFGGDSYSKNPVPSKDDADNLPPIDPKEVAKASGSGGVGGGIGSVPRVVAGKPLTMDEMRAARTAAGFDLDALEKQGIAGLKDVSDLESEDAKKAAQETRDRIAKQGVFGAEREKKLQERVDEMPGREKSNEKDAYITAGLAMLTSPSGGRGWKGAIAPIAAGAGIGFKQYRAGEKDLRAEKEKVDDAMLALREARKDRENADAKEISAADRAVARTTIDAKKAVVNYTQTMGLKKTDAANDLFKEYDKNYDSYLTRDEHAQATNATNATHVLTTGIAAAARASSGASKYAGMKPAELERTINAEADDMMRSPGNMGMTREQARTIAREVVRRELQGLGPAPSRTGFSGMQVTP